MIAYAMLYSVAVGAPIVLAAMLVSAVLRRYGRAERFVWLGALLLAVGLPLLTLVRPGIVGPIAGVGAADAEPTGIIGLPTVFVVPGGPAGFTAGALILWAWLAVSAVLLARTSVAVARLARARGSWRASTLDGVPVWMTRRIGPAVAGILRPRVLVPEWLLHMPEHRRSLVLLHEQEHIRAGDPWLMALSRVAPVLAPWNPVLWILSARLLRAIELDCDRRVLRQRPDVRAYGSTLIDVSTRDSGRLAAVAAFAESEAPLRTRILSMTTPPSRVSRLKLIGAVAAGVTLLVGACQVPVPTTDAAADEGGAPEPAAVAEVEPQTPDSDEPSFTPFSVAPKLLNVEEVKQALAREYPSLLRDAGIGGTVTVWFHIDEDGTVMHRRLDLSSGLPALDEAALHVADVFDFSPAVNRDRRVAVWVSLPITFQVR